MAIAQTVVAPSVPLVRILRVVIVRLGDTELHDKLVLKWSADPATVVLYDRRSVPRSSVGPCERRHRDDAEILRTRGFYVQRLLDGRTRLR